MSSETSPVAIVTGASSGIGRELAVMLGESGYRLALIARRAEALDATAARVREDADPEAEPLCLPTDLMDGQAIQRAVARVQETFGRIDVLANVAGNAPLLKIDQITPEIWRECIDVNLSATVLMTAAAWGTFKRQKSGLVVNVSSMAAFDPFKGFSIYAAAKVGVNMFTKCTADEGKSLGVRALAVAPGAVETPMLRQNFPENILPREKAASPEAIAMVIHDCITGARDFESGQTIILNE